MASFFNRPVFGKKRSLDIQAIKDEVRHRGPDADGVARVFPKQIWDDPKVGAFLREMGISPDDPRNIRKSADDRRAELAQTNARLDARIAAFNAENTARYGHCKVSRFLLIDAPIWEGKNQGFLIGQLGLCPYDDWNVMLLAADGETLRRCPVLPNPGRHSALLEKMEAKVGELLARYEKGLDLFGLTATLQKGGITREAWESLQGEIHADLMAYVAIARRVLSEGLERFKADVLSGKVVVNG